MAKTPWEMAAVGKEFSHQTALFAWAAMARNFGVKAANDPLSYSVAGHAVKQMGMLGLSAQIPELRWLHAIKNAEKGGAVRGALSQAEGVRSGVFDVFLPEPAAWTISQPFGVLGSPHKALFGYCGLYIELKTPDRIGHKNGGASDAQLEFQRDMRAAGYAAEICHGWEAARDCLLTYLGKSAA